jgi:uncharacterized protein YuzE
VDLFPILAYWLIKGMEKTINLESIFQAVPLLIGFPVPRFYVDYDKEADVLYISFERPQKATDTEMTDEGMLFRYRDDKLVGITILDASTRN